MKVIKGDKVKVLYGKDSGKTGKVLKVVSRENKVVVEGVNLFKKHVKGDKQGRRSEIVEIVKPLHLAKVMLVCPECEKSTRVSLKMVEGKKVRSCKKCGKVIGSAVTEVKAEKVVKSVKKTENKSKVKKAE